MSLRQLRLRLITFDVTGTLLQLRQQPGKQYGEIGGHFGVRCDNDDPPLAKNFKISWRHFSKEHPNFGCYSNLGWENWWMQVIAKTFSESGCKIPEEKLQKLSEYLIEIYKSSAAWQNRNGSIELLNYLKTQQQSESIRLGVISNFDSRLPILLQNMKIKHFFDFILNSYDCKMEKPQRDFFDLAIRSSGVADLKPEQCLHIGDNPDIDYLGAKNAGWNAALIHEKDQEYFREKYGDKIEERHCFSSLFDFHKKLASGSISWQRES